MNELNVFIHLFYYRLLYGIIQVFILTFLFLDDSSSTPKYKYKLKTGLDFFSHKTTCMYLNIVYILLKISEIKMFHVKHFVKTFY